MSHSQGLHYSRLRGIIRFDQIAHHDDMEIVAALIVLPILTVFECQRYDDQFTFVRRTSSEKQFRIRTSALEPVPHCRFMLGQVVEISGSEPVMKAQIHRIEWHVKRCHEVYYVIKNDRQSGKMYLPNEFVSTS